MENTKAYNKFICCICGKECKEFGNNPAPVKNEGKCCDECNSKIVIPARLKDLGLDK